MILATPAAAGAPAAIMSGTLGEALITASVPAMIACAMSNVFSFSAASFLMARVLAS
jgi:hypothetical protein